MCDWANDAAEQEKLFKQVEMIGIHPKSQAEQALQAQPLSPQDTPRSTTSTGTREDNIQLSRAELSLLQKVVRKGLIESKYDIDVQRKDPNSPLYSVKSFDALRLKPTLLRGIYEMGFNAPSKIQEAALPTLLADPPQNMIAQSQSGTGKTAAFVLAMLSRVEPAKEHPQVLCLAPTYELAIQIGDVVVKMAQFCPEILIRYAVRGEAVERGSKLKEHIIVGTPGKVLDWALKYRFFDISRIKVFVLDEADIMVATQGHQDQSLRIRKALPKDCQMMFFSSTYDEDVMEFAEAIVDNPVTIRLKREEESLENIKQYYIQCLSEEDKYTAIANIYGVVTIGQAMIFCQTRCTASWLAGMMTRDGHAVAQLSGELTVEERLSILDRFREGKVKVLITTNVLARGIDIQQVTLVVNYDLPLDHRGEADCETYLHRIGRSGRFGKNGLAINLIDSSQGYQHLMQIQDHFGKVIEQLDANDVTRLAELDI